MQKNILHIAHLITVCTAILIGAGFTASAETPAQRPAQTPASKVSLPDALMYNGAPIHPACFRGCHEPGTREALPVTNCEENDIKAAPLEIIGPETIRAEYTYINLFEATDDPATIQYRYIGENDRNGLYVLITENTGGTGVFTSLYEIERRLNTMAVRRSFMLGDRCTNGVLDANVKDGALYYSANLTPLDILEAGELKALTPYEDLEASAASCFGIGHFKNRDLQSIELADNIEDREGWTERYTYQTCYNALHREYVAQSRKTLTREELADFAKQFKERCLLTAPATQDTSD